MVRTKSGRNPLAGIARKDIEKGEKAPNRHLVAEIEKETIINYNEAEPLASIFTYNRALIKHLKTRFKLTPLSDNGFGGLTFELDKSRLRFPQPKRQSHLTPEQKRNASDRLKKIRARKSA